MKKSYPTHTLALLTVTAALSLHALPSSADTAASAGVSRSAAARASTSATAPLTLDFPGTEIDAVARAMAAILGRPILVDPRVKGKVTLFTDEPVAPQQAYLMFQNALRGLGIAVVDSGGVIKVLPENDAKLQAGLAGVPAVAMPRPTASDDIATQVFRVNYENASNLVAVLRPLITPNNTINVNPGNNSLVITDYRSNLARIDTIISALDTPSATDVEVIPLEHAVASEIATTVQRLVTGASLAGGATPTAQTSTPAGSGNTATNASIVADPHLNALLVRAPNRAQLSIIRALVARLDVDAGNGTGGSNVHVIYLKNAESTRIAAVLRAAFPNDPAKGNSGNGASYGSSSGVAGSGQTSGGMAAQQYASSSSSSSSGASTQAATPVTAVAAPSTGGYIQADPATNSLIITAPAPLFREIRAVVDELDGERAQVYVESLVVEVDASKARSLGMQWETILNLSKTSTISIGSIVSALDTMAGTNILSTANVTTLDNEEAKIVVGQNVPFVTGSYTTSSSSTVSPFQTVERKDVGVTLRIRPQISANGQIRLTIYQEASSVADQATGTSNTGPTTNKRSVETTVSVKDGHIVVIGGLIEDSYTNSASDIPGISSIPIIGSVFRTMGRTRKKTNLLVFLRPIVLRDSDALNELSLDRYDQIRARQQEIPEDARQVLPLYEAPALPADAGEARRLPQAIPPIVPSPAGGQTVAPSRAPRSEDTPYPGG